jgi:hypothetical protein
MVKLFEEVQINGLVLKKKSLLVVLKRVWGLSFLGV